MTSGEGPSGQPLDPVASLVKGYLVERVRSLSEADPELFEKAFDLYDTLERHHREAGHEHVKALSDHPALSGLLRLLGRRAHQVFATGLRIARDNERIDAGLRARLVELEVDPATPEGIRRATIEYERILSATVPLEQSLENVAAIADTIELGNSFLNATSRLKRHAFRAAWALLSPLILRDADARAQVEQLREELTGNPARMLAMASLVRKEGPRIVREAYRRGSAAPSDVLPSGGS